jgi:Uncharacterized ACR, COG1993
VSFAVVECKGRIVRSEAAFKLRKAVTSLEDSRIVVLDLSEGFVLKAGAAKRVCIYVGEDQQYHGHSAYAAILDFLFYRGVSGATIMRGIAGFGADHHIHTTRLVELAENLPVKVEFGGDG